MQTIHSKLSNLDSLVAFEAAARLSSFALAAKELNVTASAVSQQIKGLEQNLGVELFVRGHRSVQLTERGREFSSSVSLALLHLSNAATDLSQTAPSLPVTIAADTSIVTHWLMPNMAALQSAFPDQAVRVYTTDVRSDLLNSNFDLAIVHGRGGWRGFESVLLFAEEVFPVCSPEYIDCNPKAADIDALPEGALLDLEYEHWHWMNWTIWLTETGLAPPSGPRAVASNNYPSLIDAAKRGRGFALAWRHLHEIELASGELVAPFDASVVTANGYHLAWPFEQNPNPVAREMVAWVQRQFSATKNSQV